MIFQYGWESVLIQRILIGLEVILENNAGLSHLRLHNVRSLNNNKTISFHEKPCLLEGLKLVYLIGSIQFADKNYRPVIRPVFEILDT